MTDLSSLQACLFAGQACPNDRYILLSVLLACSFVALVYSAYQLVIKHSTSSKGLLRFTALAIMFDLGVIIARLVETNETWWPSAVLTVLSTGAFYIGGISCVLNLLLKPIRFMSIPIPFNLWILLALYIGCFVTSSVLLLVGVAAEVELDYPTFNYYLGVYFAILAGMFVLFIMLISIVTRLLLHAMKQINQRYDGQASLSAKRRRNLIKNSKRLGWITMIEGILLVAFSSTISGLLLTPSDSSSGLLLTPSDSSSNADLGSIPIIWFVFKVISIVLMMTYLIMFRSRRFSCLRRNRLEKAQQQQQQSRPVRTSSNNNLKRFVKSASNNENQQIPTIEAEDDVEKQQEQLPKPLPTNKPRKRFRMQQLLQPIKEEDEEYLQSKEIPFIPNLIDDEQEKNEKEPSLYVRIGGQKAMEQMVLIFLNRILEDDRVKGYFGQSSPSILRKKLEMFFILVTGGPALYSGRTLRETHAHLHINGETFDVVANHIKVSLETLKVPEQDVNLIMERVRSFRSEVLGIDEGDESAAVTRSHAMPQLPPTTDNNTTTTDRATMTHALTVQ